MVNSIENRKVNCLVLLSGGLDCAAALWYAKRKGWNPLCLHLYNPNIIKQAEPELAHAQLQADFFNVELVIDDKSSLPQETKENMYSVLQGMSAIAMIIQGNKDINFQYIIWGANADDSFRQRLQLRYPLRALAAGQSHQLEVHGVKPRHIVQAPLNVFPFEYLYKSEIISMITQDKPELLDIVWGCSGEYKVEKGFEYIPCGKCTKCLEFNYAKHTAKKSLFKKQEGKWV